MKPSFHYDFVLCPYHQFVLVDPQICAINLSILPTLFNCNIQRLFAVCSHFYHFVLKMHFDLYWNLPLLCSRNVAFASHPTKTELNCLHCHATITSIPLASQNGFGSTPPARSASTTFLRAVTLFDQQQSFDLSLYMLKYKEKVKLVHGQPSRNAIVWISAWFEIYKFYTLQVCPLWSNTHTDNLWILVRKQQTYKSSSWVYLLVTSYFVFGWF